MSARVETYPERLAREAFTNFDSTDHNPETPGYEHDDCRLCVGYHATVAAIRTALDEAAKVAREASCEGPECETCGCQDVAVTAIEALKG